MSASEPERRREIRRGWMPLIVAGVALAAVLAVVAAIRADVDPARGTSDFRDFWLTAKHFRETGQIRSDLGVHNYLPFFAILMAPWSLLPLKAAVAVFTVLSLGLLAISVVMAEMLLGDGLAQRPRPATWIAVGLLAAYVVSGGVLGQVGLLLLFLIVTTWFLVERGREWEAGITLGLAVAIKLLPAVLVVYFVLKQRWRVAGTAAAAAVVLGLGLPLTILGYGETVRQHEDFYRRAVRDHSARTTILAEAPRKAKYSNNALPIVLRRVLSHTDGDPHENRPGLFVNFVDLPRGAIWWIYLGLMAGILVGSMAAAVRGPPQWPPADVDGLRALRAQFGIWCCLMLLATPLLWTHYLVLAYWPLAWAADRAERTQRAGGHPCRTAALALVAWLVGALLLSWPAARSAGAQVGSVLCLWLALFVLAMRVPLRRAPAT
jgi:hypothetical protein